MKTRFVAILATGVLTGAVAVATAAEPPALHVVVLSEAAPLPSEAKALARLEAGLARPGKGRRFTVTRAAAAEDERRLAAAYLGPVPPAAPPPLPASWGARAALLVLELRPPTGEAAARVSGGLGAVLVFHPPDPEPTLVYVPAGLSGVSLSRGWSEAVGPWLVQALALAPEAP
jgi:hypothetical protein